MSVPIIIGEAEIAYVAPSVRYSGSELPGSWQGLSGLIDGIGTGPSFPGHELFGMFGPGCWQPWPPVIIMSTAYIYTLHSGYTSISISSSGSIAAALAACRLIRTVSPAVWARPSVLAFYCSKLLECVRERVVMIAGCSPHLRHCICIALQP
eukprot:COSAG02_NODE_1185_length_14007_cov_52.908398_11_plen_152_part_00